MALFQIGVCLIQTSFERVVFSSAIRGHKCPEIKFGRFSINVPFFVIQNPCCETLLAVERSSSSSSPGFMTHPLGLGGKLGNVKGAREAHCGGGLEGRGLLCGEAFTANILLWGTRGRIWGGFGDLDCN